MDYYNILEIDKSATQEEIKQAYRKLAMQYHPDRSGGDKDKFQQIQTAYNVLSDPEQRSAYDNPQRNNNFRFEFNNGGGDFFDQVFRQFHGQPGFGFTFNQQRQQRNRDLRIFLEVELVETLNEQEKTISVRTSTGERIPLKINIPRGVQPGTTLRISGQGDNAHANLPRGDLYINIQVNVPDKWNILDNNLVTQFDISSFEAILGAEKEITTIENKQFIVKIPAGIQNNSKLAIRGQGIYVIGHEHRGDIILLINIITPTNLTAAQIDLITQAKNIQ